MKNCGIFFFKVVKGIGIRLQQKIWFVQFVLPLLYDIVFDTRKMNIMNMRCV